VGGALPKLRQTFNNSLFRRDSSLADSTRRSSYKPLALKDENSNNWLQGKIQRHSPNYGLASGKDVQLKKMMLIDSMLFPKRFTQTRDILTPLTHDS
jgi:hypothetical protein